ncbi:hypothetical protein HZQ14_19455 [Elizabethkingia anophelis]|nr:hypothetical protein [Elizabethkingia anophelis]
MRKILTTEIQKEKCNAAALGLFNSAMSSGAPENKTAQEENSNNNEEEKSKRLEILEASLAKKEAELQRRFDNHFGTWKQTNGQPMNDKRNGGAFFRKVEKQNDAIRNMQASIQKTKDAIDREKSTTAYVKGVKSGLPKSISSLIDKKGLTQWRKYPNRFFVVGVDKARIIWNDKKNRVEHKYTNTIQDPEQRKKFAQMFNSLHAEFNKK